jgi:glutaminyl-tRNA synthetase
MKSVESICEKLALKNAIEFGKAQVDPIMRIIMGTHEELRSQAKKVKETLEEKVAYINSLEKEQLQKLQQEKYPELLDESTDKQEKEQVEESVDFIREIINHDIETGRFNGRVHTRFPPEPNGYLHIGHAKSINLNYGIAEEYGGKFNLRFDDTNPITEEEEYVKSIIRDVKWLGADFEDRLFFASDYFDQFYEYAEQLIEKGLAYIDEQKAEVIREQRGSFTEPGVNSPFRDRSIEENLDLFRRMKKGEFPDGVMVLRTKIDMSSPNPMMRDPIIYRILHREHHNTGDKWCIYPTYDWAHGLEDSIERITHSICTLEFEIHRELYDWFLNQLEDENGEPIFHPQQIEFARLDINYTVLSKRKLRKLVEEGYIEGWDDPRLLTISAMRRRGITPEAIRDLCETVGVTKRDTIIDHSIFDKCIRDDLFKRCPRIMAVINPLKVIITNYPEEKTEKFEIPFHPNKEEMGSRKVVFSRKLFIEQEDFMDNPSNDFRRLSPGKIVRLKYAYCIKCDKIIKNKKTGEISELHCSYYPESYGGTAPEGMEIEGTIHWITAEEFVKTEIRLYEKLFLKENPLDIKEGKEFTDYINPNSLQIVSGLVEPTIKNFEKGDRFQFERLGYFNIDPVETTNNEIIINRIITLFD